MTDEIYIPPECFEPKAYFWKRPDAVFVKEIKDFIKNTGKPHLWPGHTHTKPTKGCRIEYLDEFDLPEALQISKGNWAPCPCCSPAHPKYYKRGKIGWFPDEGLIRNMGPDCFAGLDKEGHQRAVKQLREEQELAKAINMLLSNLPKAPGALSVLQKAVPVVAAIDEVRKMLRKEVPLTLKTSLWDHIKDGKLKLKSDPPRKEPFVYATIDGFNMLDPNQGRLSNLLKTAIESLGEIQLGSDYKTTIAAMSPEVRATTARSLGSALNSANSIFRGVEDIRQFLSITTIATLRNWGKHEQCPIRIYAMMDGLNLTIGRQEFECRRFEIPAEFFHRLGSLPVVEVSELAA